LINFFVINKGFLFPLSKSEIFTLVNKSIYVILSFKRVVITMMLDELLKMLENFKDEEERDLNSILHNLKKSESRALKKIGYKLEKQYKLEGVYDDEWDNTWDDSSGDGEYTDGVPY
jgi:hypothetical protein